MERNGITVKGHKGTWYVIDEVIIHGRKYYLLEHETYGEDVPCVAIRENGSLLLDDIHNGVDDIWEYLMRNGLLR